MYFSSWQPLSASALFCVDRGLCVRSIAMHVRHWRVANRRPHGRVKHSVALGERSSATLVRPCTVLPLEHTMTKELGMLFRIFVICILTLKGLIHAFFVGCG